MKIISKGRRLLLFVLAFAMLLTMLPPLSLPARSDGLVDSLASNSDPVDYGANIGAVAQWNNVTSVLLASNHYESKGDVCGGVPVRLLPGKLAIVGYAYDEAQAVVWYKVDAAPGYTWPEEYANYHWVDAYTIRIVAQNGMTGVYDEAGNEVTELTMGVYDTPVLIADSSLQGSVKYQWQIEYEAGMWVDIYGENEKELTVTIGILASLLDSNDTVKVRCVSRTEGKSATSTEIAVKVSWNADGDSDETTTQQEPVAPSDAPALRSAAANEGVAATAEVEEYTVTIAYQYENGEQAFEYFIGEVSPGIDLTETVIFPVIAGYAPYLNNEQVNSLKLNVIGDEVTEDILYVVVYKPALVNVTVVIEHQNIYDDGYTPVETRVIQRLTGSYIETITEFADKYPGFYQLEHSKPEVAADGSTTVTIKFNRLYYLMRFDLGEGGYGVQPVYARIDTEVEVPDPRRPGYIFQNWLSYNGSVVNSTGGMAKFTMPAYACTVTALWEATEVNYTVVYWKENADPNADGTYGYSYWTSEVVPSKAGEYVSGGNTVKDIKGENAVDDAKYFTYNDARTDKNVLVKGDSSTVVNVYYTRNSYTIYFTGISGTCVLNEHTHGTGCNSYLICGKEVHTHTADCDRSLTCGMAIHTTHTNACVTCGKAEHTAHTDACLTCEKPIHSHSSECCTITEHSHSSVCCLTKEHEHDSSCLWGIICNKTEHTHGDGKCTCLQATHTHGTGNCTCTKEEHAQHTDACYDELHTHSDACYTSCTIHTEHTDSCYTYRCGNTGHTHTNACYSECSLPVHTHTKNNPNCNGNSTSNVIYVITAKYEATIGNIWPTADKFSNITLSGWSIDDVNSTAVSKRVNMTSDLCDEETNDGDSADRVKYGKAVEGGSKKYLYYMFESLDQTSPADGNNRIKRNGVWYEKSGLYYQEVNFSGGFNQKKIMGMDPVSNGVVTSGSNIFLYYNRVRYKLEFKNVNEVIHTENQVLFEKRLNYYLDEDGKYIDEIIPDYPEGKEAGAYEFAGWYTTPECFEGTEFDFATGKMPNGDLTLFAKWAPVKHNVTFYTYKDSETGLLMDKIGDTVAVPHGSRINEQYIPEAPEDFDNGQYTFDGWFYMDHGEEKAFSFADMAVTQELNVYARWISNKQINYVFYFVTADGTEIADPVTGSGLAGETITVNAKGDTALYAGYQTGYFPNAKSHSIDLDIEDEDGLMEYRFVYEPVDAVPYAVYYVAETLKEGGTSLGTIVRNGKTYHIIAETDLHNDNHKAYVVEQFKSVPGYLPDAYQKASPIANGDTNEIIFYYTVDDVRAYYKITHYIRNLDGTSWTEYRVIQSQGLIGSGYNADPLVIPGFTYNSAIEGTLTYGELTADGLELKLYYERNKYPYKVIYKVQGTEAVLYEGTVETDFYEKIVSHPAPSTYGVYDLVDDATKTLSIRIEDDPTNPKLNVLTFYYAEREVDIDYKLVGPDGTVYDENQEWGALTSFGESVKVTTGTVNGSTASAKSNAYKFVGWYGDPECLNFITGNASLVPAKEDGVTYYAKFEYNLTTLTIRKTGWNSVDENQTFLFKITDGQGFELTVTVHGNGSVMVDGLQVGKEYTIIEISKWSWRYTNKGVVESETTVQIIETSAANGTKITLNPTGSVITFTNERNNPFWLDGDSWCNNIFKK